MRKRGVRRFALGVGMCMSLGVGYAAPRALPVRPPADSTRPAATVTPEQTVQIKLRDLLGLVPAKPEDLTELIARLKAIEGQLIRIEQICAAIAGSVGPKVQTNPYPEPLPELKVEPPEPPPSKKR